MSFDVHPERLDKFGQRLTDLGSQGSKAKEYAEKHLNLGFFDKGIFGSGLWSLATSRMEEVNEAIVKNMARLEELTRGTKTELDKTAHMYRVTDHATAEALDNTY